MLSRPIRTVAISWPSLACNGPVPEARDSPSWLPSVVAYWRDKVAASPLHLVPFVQLLVTPKIDDLGQERISDCCKLADILLVSVHLIVSLQEVLSDCFPFALRPLSILSTLPGLLLTPVTGPRTINRQPSISLEAPDAVHGKLMTRRAFEGQPLSGRSQGIGGALNNHDASVLYANRQKVSDIFLRLLRDCSRQIDRKNTVFRRQLQRSVQELSAKLDRRLVGWFSQFFLSEYLSIADETHGTMDEKRLEKLERRLQDMNMSDQHGDSEMFFLFIELFDSHSFNHSLRRTVEGEILAVNERLRGSGHGNAAKDVRSLLKAASLLRHMCELTNLPGGGLFKSIVVSWARRSLSDCHLSLNIWWLLSEDCITLLQEDIVAIGDIRDYLTRSTSISSSGRIMAVSFWNDRVPMESRILFESCQWTLPGLFPPGCYDSDPSAASGLAAIAREYSSSYRRLYRQCTEGLVATLKPSSPTSSLAPVQPLPLSLPPGQSQEGQQELRKVRPVSEVSGDAFEAVRLQKRLRRWFWWMYPSVREAIDSLCNFLIEQVHASDQRHTRLDIVLSGLTPAAWQGKPELEQLLSLLAHEQLDRLSSAF